MEVAMWCGVAAIFLNAMFLFFIWRALLGSNMMAFKTLQQLVNVEKRLGMLERLLRENSTETRGLKEAIERENLKNDG